jgi:sterol desaturase/sphingolipid hydroxylase (fatty acid hydroxylase superfamily)
MMIIKQKDGTNQQAERKVPWHYDHHMGKNQEANWGITTDWVDKLLRTRIKY